MPQAGVGDISRPPRALWRQAHGHVVGVELEQCVLPQVHRRAQLGGPRDIGLRGGEAEVGRIDGVEENVRAEVEGDVLPEVAVGRELEPTRPADGQVLPRGEQDAAPEVARHRGEAVVELAVVDRGGEAGLFLLVAVASLEGVGILRLEPRIAGAEIEGVDVFREGVKVVDLGAMHPVAVIQLEFIPRGHLPGQMQRGVDAVVVVGHDGTGVDQVGSDRRPFRAQAGLEAERPEGLRIGRVDGMDGARHVEAVGSRGIAEEDPRHGVEVCGLEISPKCVLRQRVTRLQLSVRTQRAGVLDDALPFMARVLVEQIVEGRRLHREPVGIGVMVVLLLLRRG